MKCNRDEVSTGLGSARLERCNARDEIEIRFETARLDDR